MLPQKYYFLNKEYENSHILFTLYSCTNVDDVIESTLITSSVTYSDVADKLEEVSDPTDKVVVSQALYESLEFRLQHFNLIA